MLSSLIAHFKMKMIAFLLVLQLFFSSAISSEDSLYVPTVDELQTIKTLVDMSSRGKYSGSTSKRPRKDGKNVPVWSQRTALLFFNRKTVSDEMRWKTITMGHVGNFGKLVTDKKESIINWEKIDPERFEELGEYLPMEWSDVKSFEADMEEDLVYVYKPIYGSQGKGIKFMKGLEILEYVKNKHKSRWIIQEFVEPFTYRKKKTHTRVVTLVILQPNGERQFFLYDKMKLFTAPQDYDQSMVVKPGEDNSFMLITNLHKNLIWFNSDPMNHNKIFRPSDYVMDMESKVDAVEDGVLTYSDALLGVRDMHSVIYSIIGDVIMCKPTEVSIFNNSCFHILATDVAFNEVGSPYYLEMNTAMGFKSWKLSERIEMFGAAASLVNDPTSPYDDDKADTSMWIPIPLEV
jgi:hypothetical protein